MSMQIFSLQLSQVFCVSDVCQVYKKMRREELHILVSQVYGDIMAKEYNIEELSNFSL